MDQTDTIFACEAQSIGPWFVLHKSVSFDSPTSHPQDIF